MLKAHSAGIGDLLRSSAAWRCLRNAFPDARLHLWFLSDDPGAPSEELIARHHLLYSFQVSDKRGNSPETWTRLLREGGQIVDRTRPDLIIDFEPNGIRTSILALYAGMKARALTVGVAQAPLRGWFYGRSAPKSGAYAKARGLPLPMEYTERDFVALAAMGIERKGVPIELRETNEAKAFQARLLAEVGGDQPLFGLNIGCGTSGAAGKRPNFELLAAFLEELWKRQPYVLALTGAPNESEINRNFLRCHPPRGRVLDLAGRCNIRELPGAIKACRLFISSDSGPYHMAVGLRVPTLAIFTYPNREHFHQHPWVECVVAPAIGSLTSLVEAAERLLRVKAPVTSP